MKEYLSLAQIVIAVALIILILLQKGGTALGSSFGQEGGAYATKRGAQKRIFTATIISGVLFIILAVLNLIV